MRVRQAQRERVSVRARKAHRKERWCGQCEGETGAIGKRDGAVSERVRQARREELWCG